MELNLTLCFLFSQYYCHFYQPVAHAPQCATITKRVLLYSLNMSVMFFLNYFVRVFGIPNKLN